MNCPCELEVRVLSIDSEGPSVCCAPVSLDVLATHPHGIVTTADVTFLDFEITLPYGRQLFVREDSSVLVAVSVCVELEIILYESYSVGSLFVPSVFPDGKSGAFFALGEVLDKLTGFLLMFL